MASKLKTFKTWMGYKDKRCKTNLFKNKYKIQSKFSLPLLKFHIHNQFHYLLNYNALWQR